MVTLEPLSILRGLQGSSLFEFSRQLLQTSGLPDELPCEQLPVVEPQSSNEFSKILWAEVLSAKSLSMMVNE